MIEEMVYTSAPKGLRSGSSGFCTVEATEGMKDPAIDLLESLSAYDASPSSNVNWMHLKQTSAGSTRHIFSRVAPLRGEFSGRSNKLAHHVCVSQSELPPAGPFAVLGQGGLMFSTWSGQVRRLPRRTSAKSARPIAGPSVCRTWQNACGDAGVAGGLLSRLLDSSGGTIWLVRSPEMDALALTEEMVALLPSAHRWNITFTTYLHKLSPTLDCRLRWVLENSPSSRSIQNLGTDRLFDLREARDCDRLLQGTPDAYVRAARSGALISRLPSTDSPATQKNAPEGISVSAPAISRREAYSSSAIGLPTGDVSTRQQVVPPPAPEPISPLKLIGLGLAVGVIPAVLLLWFAFASPTDTEAKVAELKVEIKKAPTEAIAPKIDEAKAEKERRAREKEQKAQALKEAEAKAKAQAERKAKEDEARRRRKEQQQQRMIARPAVKKRQSLRVKIGFPEKGLGGASSYLVDQGKTYDYAKLTNRFQNKKSPIDYRLTQSPGVGWRIDGIRHQPSSADQEREFWLADLVAENDQLLMVWAPDVDRADAAIFLIFHGFAIAGPTHETMFSIEFAPPLSLKSYPVLSATLPYEIELPEWLQMNLDWRIRMHPLFDGVPLKHLSRQSRQLFVPTLRQSGHVENPVAWNLGRVFDGEKFNEWEAKTEVFFLREKDVPTKFSIKRSLSFRFAGQWVEWRSRNNAINDEVSKMNERRRNQPKISPESIKNKLKARYDQLSMHVELIAMNGEEPLVIGVSQ